MAEDSSRFDVTLEEALELGRREGNRQILQEIDDLLRDVTDLKFLKTYIKGRLSTLTSPLNFKGDRMVDEE